jgi:signal transduction histidine kinase
VLRLTRPERRRSTSPVESEGASLRGRQVDELLAEVSELRASRRRLALAIDAERRGFERALHDGVQQRLVGLAANLELAAGSAQADPSGTKRLLMEMRRDARQTMEDARALAERIYPPMLESGGLRVALRSAAAGADVPIRIEIGGDPTYPPEVAGTVYFCCLDVLERAGAGTTVTITVRNEGGTLAFEIVADGDAEVERVPMGDRVEAMGGRLTIGAGSGGETRVAGSLPVSG